MKSMDIEKYNEIRSGRPGVYEKPRGLIVVWGKEAVPFLDGLITNNVKALADGEQMLAAFPNAQGRLLAIVRVLRQGERFLFETEEATRERVFQNLFRFTFAGDFFVEDIWDKYRFADTINFATESSGAAFRFSGRGFDTWAVPHDEWTWFSSRITEKEGVEIDGHLYEALRIESGVPKYGVDMDETTIVPELGLDGLISYNKGCYIGQEIIARIHFRGHVAKSLAGLVFSSPPYKGGVAAGQGGSQVGTELASREGKNAGRITSVTFSPKLDRTIALAYVRYDYLATGTELLAGEQPVTVTPLPFV
jgi:folate-binding protein YgfZ